MDLQENHNNGDWLVHQYHGVGQLKGREMKKIGGTESIYYRLEMEKGTIFVPEEMFSSEWFRPVASQNTLTEVKEVLARPSKKMARNFNTRKSEIKEVMVNNSLVEIARMIRDLYGRRRRRNTLSATEDSLLRKLQNRLLAEWKVAGDLDEGEAERKMAALLAKQS